MTKQFFLFWSSLKNIKIPHAAKFLRMGLSPMPPVVPVMAQCRVHYIHYIPKKNIQNSSCGKIAQKGALSPWSLFPVVPVMAYCHVHCE